nr:MAG TPA: hypothetical protein [Microviridae sp.]
MFAVPGLSYQQEENMGSSPGTGEQVPFAQFILNSDLFGRKFTEDGQREWVDATAQTLAGLLEEVAPPGRTCTASIFRSRGVRGEVGEAALPSGDFWGVQVFLRAKSLLDSV